MTQTNRMWPKDQRALFNIFLAGDATVLDAVRSAFCNVTSGDCWEWNRGVNLNGYGHVHGLDKKNALAHRVFYLIVKGNVPEGLVLDHICSNRICVNPEHLVPATQRENILRGSSPFSLNAKKTHCIHGHALTEENIYRPPKKPNCRYCRTCHGRRVMEASHR